MAAQDWRERKKAQTRQRLQEQALRLFTERGYEATTVEQIAAAAGVSHMTFFRYFPTKEDAVLSDSYDPLLVAAIRSRPRTEHPVTRIHAAVREGLGGSTRRLGTRCWCVSGSRCGPRRCGRGCGRTSSPRGISWPVRFEDGEPTFATRILASAVLATLTTALEEWVATDGEAELPDLIDEAFLALSESRQP